MRQATPDILGAALAGEPVTRPPEMVDIAGLRRDGGMQPRVGLNQQYIQELAEAISSGEKLPAVDVNYDGTEYWLWDGYHRVAAYEACGILLVAANVHQGDQAAAQWESYGTNKAHGLRRSNEDKERAVRAALKHPQAAQLSNREIARHLGVDEKTVRLYKERLVSSAEIPQMTETITVQRNGQTYQQNTANIGQTRAQRLFVNELHAIVKGWVSQHWQRKWPENPSHTNGTFWQELTTWLHKNRTETWTEADLKTAIKEAYAARPNESTLLDPHEMSGVQITAEMDKAKTTGWTIHTRWNADKKFVLRFVQVAAQLATAEHRNDTDLLIALRAREYSRSHFEHWMRNQNPGTPPASASPVAVDSELQTYTIDELPVVATTGPVTLALDVAPLPLPAWAVQEKDDEEDEKEPVAAPTGADYGNRVHNLRQFRAQFAVALSMLDSWAQATGHFTATLEAERGLQHLIELTDNELKALGVLA